MMKVLVVEDNPFNMELVLEVLNAHGYAASGVVNGEEAIKKAEKEVYDMILMDIALPGIDGFDVAKTIKNKPEHKDVPIIALTAYSMEENKKRFLEAGFVDYVSKPIDISNFVKILDKYRVKWYEKAQVSTTKKDWIKPTGLDLLDNVIGGGLFPGSMVYVLSDPEIDSEIFLFHFTQPKKCIYISTEREPKYIIQEMEKLGFDISRIEFVDVFSAYHAPLTTEREGENTDYRVLEFVKKKLESIKEKDITIIVDTFNFFPLLDVNRNSMKDFVNILYNFAKNNDAIMYLLSLRDTIDKKIENEIMWQCDVIFDIRFVKTQEKIISQLMITKAKNVTLAVDTIKFFIRGRVLIDSSKEIV
jgi:two-component system cell cycle response regulator DivK